MNGKIRILDEHVSNAIAAGEVVENPASMIKELIENSLDAGATRVKIQIKNGGKYVKISDNGFGMSKEDLFLSVERHATSKINEKEDLFNLKTYGFRGEALASISAVSKMSLRSRTKESEVGNLITISGGKFSGSKECSMNIGTEIEVKNLFFNTPARQKFLKTNSTEEYKIKDIILKEALANYNTAIKLYINEKLVIDTSGNGIENSIVELFGKETLKNLIKFEYGYLGNMELVRSKQFYMYTFFNKRYAKAKMIDKAIMDAYYTRLMKGKYPFAIIFMDIDPATIDVNIHPSKKIVKFSDEYKLYNKLKKSVEESIFETERELSPSLNISEEVIREEEEILFATNEPLMKEYNENRITPKVEQKIFELEVQEKKCDKKEEIVVDEVKEDIARNKSYKILGQINNMYILVETSGELEIYDQHVVHERILYEELKKKYYIEDVKKQFLLVPVKIELSITDIDKILENLELFESYGFEIDEFGEREIVVRAVPAVKLKESIENIILDIMEKIGETTDKDDIREKIIISMSCKGAIKAGEKLDYSEMESLIDKLHELGKYTCPHGRPIIVKIPFNDLEKRFKRK